MIPKFRMWQFQSSSSIPKHRWRTRFTIKQHLYCGETSGGWYIWDRREKTWAYCFENHKGGFEDKKDALKCAKKIEEEYISKKIADEL
jgi:hypothetical protein